MGIKGRIHSFETFGTVDGPGIRFVVFMQGCPFHCLYCHNRDTWDPHGGIEYTTDQVLTETLKYYNYMKFSNGGITLSGGEPTLQAPFAAELFKKCKAQGIHTVLDTNGFAEVEDVHTLLDFTDLILLDIKHTNEDMHKKITGAGIEKVQKFAYYTAQKGIPLWIRYVLVPGLTDSENDLKSAAKFIKTLQNVEKIEVLPYHDMGIWKWEKLGETYHLSGTNTPSEQSVKNACKLLNS